MRVLTLLDKYTKDIIGSIIFDESIDRVVNMHWDIFHGWHNSNTKMPATVDLFIKELEMNGFEAKEISVLTTKTIF